MNIVCVEPIGINQSQFEKLKSKFASLGHNFTYYLDRKEDPSTLVSRLSSAHMAVISNIPLPQEVLCQCPNLKYLSVAFTGLDHIDLSYCKLHGIEVQNAAGYSTVAVSELAIGLMLDVLRRITPLHNSTLQGGSRGSFLGRELFGKTVGVVGTGAIGTATIRLLITFGCHVMAYNRSEHQKVKDMGVSYTDLDTLMRNCDIVPLHVPLTPDTYHLISSERIALMKPSAILINTARGNVVDIDALALALQQGRIAGAGIDVYEQEPPLPNQHPLTTAPNCICLPHIGYATREAFDIRADIVFNHIFDKLKEFSA